MRRQPGQIFGRHIGGLVGGALCTLVLSKFGRSHAALRVKPHPPAAQRRLDLVGQDRGADHDRAELRIGPEEDGSDWPRSGGCGVDRLHD